MTDPGQLTAAEVAAMLAGAGVDCSALDIRDDPAVWRDLETGRSYTSVVIRGPEGPRRDAFFVLLARGLSVAPYPDHDAWSRH
ncbi:MAG TPA: hypothetical protein VFQ68_39280 [Streptosporangiaceae bacterium]|nr:hypothetical protein [Streptosporangiaceae bacterium]